MFVQVTMHDFFTSINNPICNFSIENTKVSVRASCSKFENTKRSNQRTWHNVIADVKIHQGTGCLTTVVLVTRDLPFTHRIGFNPEFNIRLWGASLCFSTQLMVGSFDVETSSYGLNNPCTTSIVLTSTSPAIEFLSDIFGNADGDDAAVSNVVFCHD